MPIGDARDFGWDALIALGKSDVQNIVLPFERAADSTLLSFCGHPIGGRLQRASVDRRSLIGGEDDAELIERVIDRELITGPLRRRHVTIGQDESIARDDEAGTGMLAVDRSVVRIAFVGQVGFDLAAFHLNVSRNDRWSALQ